MLPEKTNISARVEITLKQIVDESTFNHKDAYELGAKLIAMGEAENTIMEINNNSVYEAMEAEGIEVIKLPLEQILKAGGGPHCMTFPVKRA